MLLPLQVLVIMVSIMAIGTAAVELYPDICGGDAEFICPTSLGPGETLTEVASCPPVLQCASHGSAPDGWQYMHAFSTMTMNDILEQGNAIFDIFDSRFSYAALYLQRDCNLVKRSLIDNTI